MKKEINLNIFVLCVFEYTITHKVCPLEIQMKPKRITKYSKVKSKIQYQFGLIRAYQLSY